MEEQATVGRIKDRERKRKQRAREKYGAAALNTVSQSEWWAANRATLSTETSQAMQTQSRLCRELLEDMETVVKGRFPDGSPIDEEFLADVIQEVKASVEEHGVTHLGYINRDDDIPPDWSTIQYWKDVALLKRLENENENENEILQTAQYVRYGLLAALPDWRVVEFLQKAGWAWKDAAKFVGYQISDRGSYVSYR